MKKNSILIIAFVTLLIIALSGCGTTAPDTALINILNEIKTSISIESVITLSNDDLLNLYGIKPEDIEEQASIITMNGIFPDEVLMIKAKDAEALSRIREKLDVRLGEVLNQSKSYDAASYAIAQKCKVDIRGNYAALFVSANHEEMTKIYNSHFK